MMGQHFFRVMMVVWSVYSFPGEAAAASVTDALKDVAPAPQFCPRPDSSRDAATGATGTGLTQAKAAPDLACAIAAEKVGELISRSGAVLVDTRPAAEFNRFHIDSALNIPAEAVRRKTFLMRHAIVLVGSGKGEQQLYSQCAQLRKDGNGGTYVLQGGMAAWTLAGLPTNGRAPALPDMVTLSAAELFVEVSNSSSRILLLPSAADLQHQMPAATLLKSERLNANLTAIGSSPAAQSANARASSVVLVAGTGLTATDFESVSVALRPRPVLVYMDSTGSYSRFVSAQKAVWAAHARGPKLPPCSLR